MTDGIDPTRPRRDTDFLHFDPPPVQKAVSRPFPDPAALPDASFGPLPRVRTDVSVQRAAGEKTPIQVGLDRFLERATPKYLVDGKSVPVPIPFRMTVKPELASGSRWGTQEEDVKRNEKELQAAAATVGLGDARHLGLFRSGRATPEDVRKVTQALIDRGRLPPSKGFPGPESRVRKMMFDYGLGIDCASYTQQAYLASRGLRREQTQLNAKMSDEDLTNLAREGFRKVAIDAARPGDILVLDPPPRSREPGHTLMVYDRREATTEEIADLRSAPGFEPGHVTAYVLDSSYGSGGTFDRGGVMRQVWYRNDDKKNWARRDVGTPSKFEVWQADQSDPDQPLDRPYDGGHTIRGVYRPAGETP